MSKMPDEKTLDKMEALLNVASDYTRLKILHAIMNEEKSVSQIVDEVGASQSLVSHQLKVLKKANLVSTRKDGHKVFYILADDHVVSLLNIVREHVLEEK